MGRIITGRNPGQVADSRSRLRSPAPRSPLSNRLAGFGAILKFVPLLWLSGLLPFCTPLVLIYIFFRDHCWKHLKDPAVGGWVVLGAVQSFSTLISWSKTVDGFGSYIYRLFSAPVSGWIFIGMLLAIGKQLHIEVPKLIRSVALVGVYLVCLGAPLLAIAWKSGLIDDLQWLTPVGHLIPSSLPSAKFEFTAQLLVTDDFVGQTIPRLVLFYPWPTCLGFAGAAIVFVCLAGERTRLNIAGLVGGLFAVFASTSRAAVVGTILGVLVFGLFQVRRSRRLIVAFGAVTALLLCLCFPIAFLTDPISVINNAEESVSGLRQDSSLARALLYKETYAQFKSEPVLGHGWQGDILEDTIPLPIGSHSTVYGLLYTGGIATFIPFVITSFILGARLWLAAAAGGKHQQTALSIFIVLMVMSYGECIYSFAIPVFFSFLWIGAGLQQSKLPLQRGVGPFQRKDHLRGSVGSRAIIAVGTSI